MLRSGQPATVSYGDALSVGQLADRWDRDPMFVRGLIADGKLEQSERGLITNAALHDFYRSHGTLLDRPEASGWNQQVPEVRPEAPQIP